MGSYTDMFEMQMRIIAVYMHGSEWYSRCISIYVWSAPARSTYRIFSMVFTVQDAYKYICIYVLFRLVSKFTPGIPCPAGHWFPHCPVSTTKVTQMAVSTCNLPRNACRRLLEKKSLADACYDVHSFLILDTNPFNRKCQNIMKDDQLQEVPRHGLATLGRCHRPSPRCRRSQRCGPAVGRTGRGLLGLCRVGFGLCTT